MRGLCRLGVNCKIWIKSQNFCFQTILYNCKTRYIGWGQNAKWKAVFYLFSREVLLPHQKENIMCQKHVSLCFWANMHRCITDASSIVCALAENRFHLAPPTVRTKIRYKYLWMYKKCIVEKHCRKIKNNAFLCPYLQGWPKNDLFWCIIYTRYLC